MDRTVRRGLGLALVDADEQAWGKQEGSTGQGKVESKRGGMHGMHDQPSLYATRVKHIYINIYDIGFRTMLPPQHHGGLDPSLIRSSVPTLYYGFMQTLVRAAGPCDLMAAGGELPQASPQ